MMLKRDGAAKASITRLCTIQRHGVPGEFVGSDQRGEHEPTSDLRYNQGGGWAEESGGCWACVYDVHGQLSGVSD